MVLQMPFSQFDPPDGAGGIGPLSTLPPSAPPMPTGLGSMLDKLLTPPRTPVYPPDYEQPEKPDKDEIISRAENGKRANQPFLDQLTDTYKRLRLGTFGYFNRNKFARETGQEEPYPSTALVDGKNRLDAYLASCPTAFSVDVYDPDLQLDAQKIEDAAYHFRALEERRWVDAGNMDLNLAEVKDLTLFGVVIARHTLNPSDPRYPFRSTLIDPATVFPVWGKVGALSGLEAVYRIVTMPIGQVMAEYSKDTTLKGKLKDALGDKIGQFGDSADVTVVEYWDTWWGGAFTIEGGVEIKPLKAHKYGCVPYVIQYGPGGEPMHTRSPEGRGANILDYGVYGQSASNDERTYKATGFIEPQKGLHDLREAFGSLYLNNVMKAFNPPRNLERTVEAAKMEMPIINDGPGETTVTTAGMERLLPMPTSPSPAEAGLLMQMMGQDTQTNLLAPGFDGHVDKSNISGTARSSMAEEGREQQQGWVTSTALFRGRGATHKVHLWRNFGHESRYTTGTKKAFYVPRRNPNDEDKSFELTPEIIDRVDTDVSCIMNSLRLSELIPFANAMSMMGPESAIPIYTLRDIAKKAGVTDIDRVMTENQTYLMIKKVMELEETGKIILGPQAIQEMIKQTAHDPDTQAMWIERLRVWEQAVSGPMQQKVEQASQPPPPPQPGQGIAGGNGAPYAALGQGPMTQGGGITGPPGPQGPPPGLSGPPMG